jgi:hypothetical protein
MTTVVRSAPQCPARNPLVNHATTKVFGGVAICERSRAGSTPGLDFYLLCEPICVSLRLFQKLRVVIINYPILNDAFIKRQFALIWNKGMSWSGSYSSNSSETTCKSKPLFWQAIDKINPWNSRSEIFVKMRQNQAILFQIKNSNHDTSIPSLIHTKLNKSSDYRLLIIHIIGWLNIARTKWFCDEITKYR